MQMMVFFLLPAILLSVLPSRSGHAVWAQWIARSCGYAFPPVVRASCSKATARRDLADVCP